MSARALALLGVLLALPMAGLVLLLATPHLDVEWENHPAHFWIVLIAGLLNAGLAYATANAACRRGDARVFLVSLAFVTSAGFLGLHALATPGVLLDTPNAGFALATPIGMLLAGAFFAASSASLSRERAAAVMRRSRLLRRGVLAVLALWALLSLTRIPPFDGKDVPEEASGPLVALAIAAIALYALAVVRYARLFRKRPSGMLLGMIAAAALLGEASAALGFSHNWHATWWEWHLLLLTGFVVVAWTSHTQWHEERFADLYLDHTSAGTHEISVLFADLSGFTSFSERHDPGEVTAMLNEYFESAIPPVVRRHGGEIDRIIGDALMVTFNRRGDQPDHAARAAAAAMDMQAVTAEVAARHEDWPRFRVGVNSGKATLSVLGTAGGRTHTVIGDTVNLASRLEGKAPIGGIAIGASTLRELAGAQVEPLGQLAVKGKAEPVDAYRLVGLSSDGQ